MPECGSVTLARPHLSATITQVPRDLIGVDSL
jgi:hypothetical protein